MILHSVYWGGDCVIVLFKCGLTRKCNTHTAHTLNVLLHSTTFPTLVEKYNLNCHQIFFSHSWLHHQADIIIQCLQKETTCLKSFMPTLVCDDDMLWHCYYYPMTTLFFCTTLRMVTKRKSLPIVAPLWKASPLYFSTFKPPSFSLSPSAVTFRLPTSDLSV